jgi:hypothetical protein
MRHRLLCSGRPDPGQQLENPEAGEGITRVFCPAQDRQQVLEARLAYFVAELPPTEYQTTAERWYDRPVTGATQDLANNNWYKRVEPVRVTVQGALAAAGTVDIKQYPL